MSDTRALQGAVAIVTGAAGGQGLETVRLFAEAGASVVAADVNSAEGARAVAPFGGRVIFESLDVTSVESWAACVRTTVDTFGAPTVLVNNAAIYRPGRLDQVTEDDFTAHLRVNLIGPFLGVQAVRPHMVANGSGSIINIASTAGLSGTAGAAAYTSSKWGLRGLSRACAAELGPYGIRVNTVFPGLIDTPMAAVNSETTNRALVSATPAGRIGRPDEVAKTSLFLASAAASYLNGAEIKVDGGLIP